MFQLLLLHFQTQTGEFNSLRAFLTWTNIIKDIYYLERLHVEKVDFVISSQIPKL